MSWLKKITNEFVENFKDGMNRQENKPSKKAKSAVHFNTAVPTIESLEASISKHTSDPVALHYDYIQLIDLFYKKRIDNKQAIDDCIRYCNLDIKLYPSFIKKLRVNDKKYFMDLIKRNTELGLPTESAEEALINHDKRMAHIQIPSFKRLAIIYEQQNKYDDAINICNKAMEYGLSDGTKGGFEAMVKRLKTKKKNAL